MSCGFDAWVALLKTKSHFFGVNMTSLFLFITDEIILYNIENKTFNFVSEILWSEIRLLHVK